MSTSTRSQTILITGATSGIGRAAALALAKRGHRVIATGRRAGALEELAAEAERAGLSLDTLLLDVTDAATVEAAVAAVDGLTAGAGLDVLVNNAGFGALGPVTEMPDAVVRAQFETNVFGLLAVTRAFVPAMRARGRGRVLNVTSGAGRVAFPFFGAYGASKFAVEALSDSMRQELQPFGVHVVVIEPGVTRTGFADHSLEGTEAYAHDGAPYAPVFATIEAMSARADRFAVEPSVVVAAMVRAIEARCPAARYVAPRAMGPALAVARALPTQLLDTALRRAFGLSRRRLAPDERG